MDLFCSPYGVKSLPAIKMRKRQVLTQTKTNSVLAVVPAGCLPSKTFLSP